MLVVSVDCPTRVLAQDSNLDLPADVPSAIRQQFEKVEKEIARTRAAGSTAEADKLDEQFAVSRELLRGPFQPPQPKTPVLHAIGMYRGHIANANAKRINNRLQGSAKVRVQQTGQPIVLLLAAYEPVKWIVEIDEGVEITKAFISGYHPQEVEGLPADLKVENFSTPATRSKIGYSTAAGNQGHELFASRVKVSIGMTLQTFQGATVHTGQTFIIGPENPGWRYQYASAVLDPLYQRAADYELAEARKLVEPIRYVGVFQAANDIQRQLLELCEFSPGGPINDTERKLPPGVTLIAHDPQEDVWYGVVNRNICQLDLEAQTAKQVASKGETPRLSWPAGLAFDTLRRRLVVASFGSGMPVYEYRIASNTWKVLSNDRYVEYSAMAYNGEQDMLYAIVRPYPKRQLSIARVAPNGELDSVVPITASIKVSRSPLEPMQLTSAGQYAILTVTPKQASARLRKNSASNVFVIDTKSGDVLYQGPQFKHDRTDKFDAAALPDLWAKLGEDESVDLMMWRMALGHNETADFIRENLPPIPKPDADRIAELIEQLDADEYVDRIAAAEELETFGGQAGEQLLGAIRDASLEAKKQVRRLILQATSGIPNNADVRREIRATQILARIPTEESYHILQGLTTGPPLHARTMAARRALSTRPTPTVEDEPPSPR